MTCGDHRVIYRVGVLGNVEVFLHDAAGIREKRPVSADAGTILVGDRDVVGADCDQTTISNFQFAVQLDEQFGLAAILWAKNLRG